MMFVVRPVYYGISWDEKTQYVIGLEAYETVFHGKEWSLDPGRRYHGPAFELFLSTLEHLFPLRTAQQVFSLRHFINFFSFALGVSLLFFFARRHFQHWGWGLLTTSMLVMSPRIFGHAFFNSRDIP